jgi:hypothetical protein
MIGLFPNASEKYLAFTFEANLDTGNFSKTLAREPSQLKKMKMLVSEIL